MDYITAALYLDRSIHLAASNIFSQYREKSNLAVSWQRWEGKWNLFRNEQKSTPCKLRPPTRLQLYRKLLNVCLSSNKTVLILIHQVKCCFSYFHLLFDVVAQGDRHGTSTRNVARSLLWNLRKWRTTWKPNSGINLATWRLSPHDSRPASCPLLINRYIHHWLTQPISL